MDALIGEAAQLVVISRRRHQLDYAVAIGLTSALKSAGEVGADAAIERVVRETALVTWQNRCQE